MIPAALRDARRWLVWLEIPHTDPTKKPRKVPYYCDGKRRQGTLDTIEDQARFALFDDALRALQAGGYSGLGFALGPDGSGNHWQGIDLDDLPKRPELHPVSATLPGYTEASPSGTGRHAIGYGRAFQTLGSNKSGIEAYTAGRYFTVTGCDPAGELCDLADFVESRLAPMHGTVIRPPAPVMPTSAPEDVTLETQVDLMNALLSMPAEDRGRWVSMGLALKSLGDEGRDIWLAWSATCPEKYDEADALATWNSFRPERTGYKAVFAEAQRHGWENPAAGARAAEVFAPALGTTPGADVPVVSRSRAVARPVTGSTILDLAGQQRLFAGHAYVREGHVIVGPDGMLSKRDQFDAWLGGYQFVMDQTNGKLSSSAWEAFTASRIYRWPKVHQMRFRPALPVGAIWEEQGLDVVNTYVPLTTPRTAGDPAPFLDLLTRLLPDDRDREILVCYLAAILQHPGVKFPWCVLIQGVEGNGKSFISDCMAEAVGRRYCYKPRSSEITGKFNDWMYGILLACVEDVHAGAHNTEVMEILKPMITERHQETEGKGKDKQTVEVCFNFLLNSNHKDAVRKTRKDRRYSIFYCAQQDEGDLARDGMDGEYFPRLYDWARAGGYAIVNDYLRSYQIPNELNPARGCHRAPDTSSTAEACRASLGAIEQEIQHAIESERVGFRGGWVSTHYLDLLLREVGAERALPRNKRRDVLRALGYVPHAGLSATDGRVNNPVAPEGTKSRLYVLQGHEAAGLIGPAVIASAYSEAQGEAQSKAPVIAFAPAQAKKAPAAS